MNQTALIRFNECINYEYEVNVNNINKNVSCDCYADTFLSSMWRAAPNVTFRARTLTFLACLGRNKSFLTLRPWRSLPLTTAITLLCGKLILKFVQSSVSCEKFRADLPCDPPWLTVARVMVRKVNSAEWRHGRRSGGGSWCVVAASSRPTTHTQVTWGRGVGENWWDRGVMPFVCRFCQRQHLAVRRRITVPDAQMTTQLEWISSKTGWVSKCDQSQYVAVWYGVNNFTNVCQHWGTSGGSRGWGEGVLVSQARIMADSELELIC